MKEEQFYCLSDESYFQYYYDEARIYLGTTQYVKLNQLQKDVLILCDGVHSEKDIFEIIQKKYQIEKNKDNEDLLIGVINKLQDKNIIKASNVKREKKIKMYGEIGKCYPISIICEITSKCNFQCPHCYKEASIYGKEMPFMKVREICDIFKDKIKTITITGGEPLLHSNCAEIILMVAKQFTTYLLTNGFYLDKISVEYLNMLKSIQISLYGYNNETYKKFTGISQGYDFLQKGIQHLHKSDIKDIIMSVVVTRENWNELDKYIESTIEMKVPFMKFGISFPSGRANSNDKFFFTEEELFKIYSDIMYFKEKYKKKIVIFPFDDINKYSPLNIEGFGCQAGKNTITINEEGYVRPCNMLPSEIFSGYTIEQYISAINKGIEKDYKNEFVQYMDYLRKNERKPEEMRCSGFCHIDI